MLSINGRKSRNATRADSIRLKKPKLKTKRVLNQLVFGRKKVLIEITCD